MQTQILLKVPVIGAFTLEETFVEEATPKELSKHCFLQFSHRSVSLQFYGLAQFFL